MNVRMTAGKQITLPDEIVEELELVPGSEVAFERGPAGEVVLAKVPERPSETPEQIRERLGGAARKARAGLRPEFADMSTDEFMAFIRGDK